VKHRQQRGIALITSLLVLLLMSTMIVGLAWLVMSDQKLGGNNSDRQLAFYGAEAGMEAMTAGIENLFDANYAPTAAEINAVVASTPTALVPGVQFLAPGSTTNGSGLAITFDGAQPTSNYETIPTGEFAGLVGLTTPYTLTVTAHTGYGSEVKLQREIQTVAIPVFQFGVFCQGDCGFHSGTDFTFGGRVHSNGNLWLASGTGATLKMSDKVTAAHEIVMTTLMNGLASSTSWTGTVSITNGSSYKTLTTGSITGSSWNIQNLAAAEAASPPTYTYNSAFTTTASGTFNNYIGVLETGVKPLNIAIATPAIGGQPIDLIRRPVQGENTANPAKYQERYYANVGMGLRILLSNYGSDGTCATSDISSTSSIGLPGLAADGTGTTPTPVDLATLAWDVNATPSTSGPPYKTAPAGLTAASVGYTVFPLPVSGAESASAYTANDGYWVKQYYPIIRGCLKIEYQNSAGGWTDVTWNILNLGYTGRNIDPQTGKNTVPAYVNPSTHGWEEPSLTATTQEVAAQGPVVKTGVQTVGCQDPSPYAVIRIARLRDNPSTAASTNDYCGNNSDFNASTQYETNGSWSSGSNYTTMCSSTATASCPSVLGTDYWPNVLFDSREGTLRDFDSTSATYTPTLAGAMYYIELDAANLGKCLTGTATPYSTYCNWGPSVAGTNGEGYAIYFSDRRDEQTDPAPPASVGGTNMLTGSYGYEDFINPANTNGCPNGALDQGEDLESDYNTNGVSLTPTTLRTYGNALNPPSPRTAPTGLWPDEVNGVSTYTQLGATPSTLESAVLENNPNCSGPGLTWPFAALKNNGGQDVRENPPIFFRHALKLVDGSNLSSPSIGGALSCNTVNCGLTIVSENPVYVQGDWNNNPNTDATFATPSTDAHVATSVIADSVTLLADSWNDVNSFTSPYDWTNRTAISTTYRLAIAAGKGIGFPNPSGSESDEGTDGGVHNFVRYLENWGSGTTSYYLGSMVNFWYSHQGYGMFKCCDGAVYNPPARSYAFDTDFLTPKTLPPLTPLLRDVNTVGFSQMILPTQ
jgi:hypothetical protein